VARPYSVATRGVPIAKAQRKTPYAEIPCDRLARNPWKEKLKLDQRLKLG
jgi:hypothetical protein